MTSIITTSIVNIIITAIMITSIIEMLSIENIKERQLCKTLCSYICDCQHIGDAGGQIVVVVIIVFSSRYVNWARLCVLGILPFGAITFLNTKIYIAVRCNFISNVRHRKSKCVYDKVPDVVESWPNNFSFHCPNFAGDSPSSGISQLWEGKTMSKKFLPSFHIDILKAEPRKIFMLKIFGDRAIYEKIHFSRISIATCIFCRPAADSILMPPTFHIASLNRYTPKYPGVAQT